MHEASKWRSSSKILTFLPLTTLQVQSPNNLLELKVRAHENFEDPHPSACSLKKYVKEIKGEVEIKGLFYTNI